MAGDSTHDGTAFRRSAAFGHSAPFGYSAAFVYPAVVSIFWKVKTEPFV